MTHTRWRACVLSSLLWACGSAAHSEPDAGSDASATMDAAIATPLAPSIRDGGRDAGPSAAGQASALPVKVLQPLDATIVLAIDAAEPPDEDAGPPPPPPPVTCQDRACLCGQICERSAGTKCAERLSLATCTEQCAPEPKLCPEQNLALLQCQAAQTITNYTCDRYVGSVAILGCEAAESARRACAIGH